MFDAMERGDLTAVYCIGENPVQSEADQKRAIGLLKGLDLLVVQDLFLTKTAELADVVLPGDRRVGRERGHGHELRAARPARPGRGRAATRRPRRPRDHLRPREPDGRRWGEPDAERVWDEVRRLSPVHAGMSYARLEALGGLQWPCYDEDHPGELYLHSRLWEDPVPGNRVPFVPVDHDPPVDKLTSRVPDPAHDRPSARLVQHGRPDRRLHLAAPARRVTRHLARGRADYGLTDGEVVRVMSRRGTRSRSPVRIDESLRPGLTFMTMHFQDDVAVNLLTIDATDPKSGTAEFKATAIRIEKLEAAVPA